MLPYDWATFLHDRIDIPTPHTDLAGIERGGYKLVFTDKQSASERMLAGARGPRGGVNVWYSLGARIGADGTVTEVKYDGVADKAGLTPGLKIFGVNGEVFSADALRQALDDSKGNTKPIHLMVQDDTKLSTLDLDYHDGQRYPSLQRVDGTTDYLDEITKPLVPLK